MGFDPHAKLFWGILYPRDEDEDDSESADERTDFHDAAWKDQQLRMAESFAEPADTGDYSTPEWDRWRERKDEWERTTIRVSAGFYGYGDALHDYLCIAQSEVSVEWDETADIMSLDVGLDWRQELLDFCIRNGLTQREPGWKLVSLYF